VTEGLDGLRDRLAEYALRGGYRPADAESYALA
jgi:hypothetical protein